MEFKAGGMNCEYKIDARTGGVLTYDGSGLTRRRRRSDRLRGGAFSEKAQSSISSR
ncbi:MAG: hypothetical protein ACLT5P_06395 [Flavonifractor plautii]